MHDANYLKNLSEINAYYGRGSYISTKILYLCHSFKQHHSYKQTCLIIRSGFPLLNCKLHMIGIHAHSEKKYISCMSSEIGLFDLILLVSSLVCVHVCVCERQSSRGGHSFLHTIVIHLLDVPYKF